MYTIKYIQRAFFFSSFYFDKKVENYTLQVQVAAILKQKIDILNRLR